MALRYEMSLRKSNRVLTLWENIVHYFSEIRGVTYKNKDGTSRQKIIEKLTPFSPLNLEPEENNEEHGYTTKVTTYGGKQIGYLMKSIANDYVGGKKKGYRYAAFVNEILEWEAYPGCMHHGVSALMIEVAPQTSDDEIREYIDKTFARHGRFVEGLLLRPFGLKPPAPPSAPPIASPPTQPSSAQKVESPHQSSPPGRAKSGCLGLIILFAIGACFLVLA